MISYNFDKEASPMPAISTETPLSVAEHIRRTVRRAAAEGWSLGELADALGMTKQTASKYVEQENLEVARSVVREPRSRDGR
jgi:hypothetical protein